jgi:hypothetical protein
VRNVFKNVTINIYFNLLFFLQRGDVERGEEEEEEQTSTRRGRRGSRTSQQSRPSSTARPVVSKVYFFLTGRTTIVD